MDQLKENNQGFDIDKIENHEFFLPEMSIKEASPDVNIEPSKYVLVIQIKRRQH